MNLRCVDMEATGNNIKTLMTERNMKTRDIAEACGFTRLNSVYSWFYGRSIPSVDTLVILSDIFNVPIDDIIIRR